MTSNGSTMLSVLGGSTRTHSSREVMKKTQEKTEKMRALQTEYRQRLNQIAQKESSLKLPDNRLPSFGARVQTSTKDGLKKISSSNAEYKTRLQQWTDKHDERIGKVASERAASIADMRAKAEAQRQQERATDDGSLLRLMNGLPNGKPPRPASSSSEPQLGTGSYFKNLSPEEQDELRERWRNPIWDKSLKERRQGERDYWKWAESVKEHITCAIDHHGPPRGGVTDRQLELIEELAAEKRYWKWASSLRSSKQCTIDQRHVFASTM